MFRQFVKKKFRSVAVRVLDMEFDVEERIKGSPVPPPERIDMTVIPNLVQGSGDTPGPNHKEKIGRSWVSAQLLSGVQPFLVDIREPKEVVSGVLPNAHCLPAESIKQCLTILPSKSQRIVVYDQTSEFGSPEIALWLRENGWSWARYLEGGFAEWVEQGERTQLPLSVGKQSSQYRIGDSVNISDGRRAFVLEELPQGLVLWSATEGYLGLITFDLIEK